MKSLLSKHTQYVIESYDFSCHGLGMCSEYSSVGRSSNQEFPNQESEIPNLEEK